MYKTFIEQCENGMATLADIDDFIHEWHNSETAQSLPDYLGMTETEYAHWVEEPEFLAQIVLDKSGAVAVC